MSGPTQVKETHHHELAAGIVLLISAIIALLFANIPSTASLYKAIIHHSSGYELFPTIGARFWINEVAMCVFFFNIGLELKYNLVNGALKNKRVATMPFLGAIGGMLVPAACFIIFNNTPSELRGWAIPTATDIAFAIGALSLVKRHVPDGLKSFLLALAIFDDIGAILIIALFYSYSINPIGMLFTVVICGLLAVLNRRRVDAISVYVLWMFLMRRPTRHRNTHHTCWCSSWYQHPHRHHKKWQKNLRYGQQCLSLSTWIEPLCQFYYFTGIRIF